MAYTKIKITGIIEVKTGLHIGGDDSFSAIGSVDSPVPPYARPYHSWLYAQGQNALAVSARVWDDPACRRAWV